MPYVGFLACGLGPEMLLYFAGVALGGLVLTLSFLVGFICLFTSKWKLGIWLASLPASVFAVAYLLVQQQKL
ncbi:MAG TPA: hypothetical protein VK850_08370 [Candidatus Binatia bacterium]|nr:hypothetical protein [Candidatus Binatia bacterium]